jgi:hypothetical protein
MDLIYPLMIMTKMHMVLETALLSITITHFGMEDVGQEIILLVEGMQMHLTGTDQEETTITTEQFI